MGVSDPSAARTKGKLRLGLDSREHRAPAVHLPLRALTARSAPRRNSRPVRGGVVGDRCSDGLSRAWETESMAVLAFVRVACMPAICRVSPCPAHSSATWSASARVGSTTSLRPWDRARCGRRVARRSRHPPPRPRPPRRSDGALSPGSLNPFATRRSLETSGALGRRHDLSRK